MNDLNRYHPPVGLLKERVILITGAGQGIGRAAALTYARHGATVILHGRNVRKLERVYDEIEALAGPQPAIFPLDLEKAGDNDFALLAESIERQLGRLDGILHNASLLPGLAPLETHTLEQWLTVLRVNLAAPSALTRACLPLLKASPDSRVVMTSETHGHVPAAYWGAFAVAKAGIEVLVRIQAQEWEILPNVRINAIIPGPVHSPQRSRTHPGEIKQNLKQPEDLMPVYLYLMGPDSNALSGEIVTC